MKTNFNYVLLAYLSLLSFGFLDNSRGPLYPEMLRDLNMSYGRGSFLFFLSTVANLFMTMTSPYWVKIGVVKATRLFLFLQSMALVVLSFSHVSLMAFDSSAILFGVASGGVTISMNLLIVRSQTIPSMQRQLFSGLHSMYGLASLVAPLLVSYALKNDITWQVYFRVSACLPLFIMVLTFFNVSEVEGKKSLPPLTFDAVQILLALSLAFYVCSEVLLSSRLVSYLADIRDVSLEKGGRYLSLFFLGLFLGRLGFAFYRGRKPTWILMLMSLIVSLVLFFFFLKGSTFWVFFIGLFMACYFPMCLTFAGELFIKEKESVVTRIIITVGILLAIFHVFYGQIAELYGQGKAIWISMGCLFLSLFCFVSCLIIVKMRSKKPLI